MNKRRLMMVHSEPNPRLGENEVKIMKASSFRLLWVVSLVLLALASVRTAFAAQPLIEPFRFEGTYVAADCGSFLALAEFVEEGRVTTFFDQAGNPTRVQWIGQYEGTLTNSVTGTTLQDPAYFRYTEDLEEGTLTVNGLWYGIRVQGEGMAVLVAGRFVIGEQGLVFESGPHQLSNLSAADICAALE
jgi:hypothetical protein